MLEDKDAIATVAVKDIAAASKFYEDTLDLPEMTRQGEIHAAGDLKVAWFKDPDGNIHSLVNG